MTKNKFEEPKRLQYVRTKDAVINFAGIKICNNVEAKKIYVLAGYDYNVVHEIPYVKVADTIEELCDWYVTVWSKDGHTEYCTYHDLDRDLFQSLVRAKFAVYGAIWTDKGLIYVAKMNGKGEFELL